MITLLTSKLNRINQEIQEEYNAYARSIKWYGLTKEKETLKKVSLMWANEMLNLFDDWDCLDEAKEMKEIKSLMEKA
jgi:hypothetical protein